MSIELMNARGLCYDMFGFRYGDIEEERFRYRSVERVWDEEEYQKKTNEDRNREIRERQIAKEKWNRSMNDAMNLWMVVREEERRKWGRRILLSLEKEGRKKERNERKGRNEKKW